MAQAVYLAQLETEHFTFEACGKTEFEARAVLERAWERHAAQTGAQPEYVRLHMEDVGVTRLEPGQCLRDGERI